MNLMVSGQPDTINKTEHNFSACALKLCLSGPVLHFYAMNYDSRNFFTIAFRFSANPDSLPALI